MRTILSNTETIGKGRRGSLATTLAIIGMALPLSGLLGGTAFAAADAAEAAALRVAAADKSNASANSDDKVTAKPAGFIGPVAKGHVKDVPAAAAVTPTSTPTPFTNQGGVTTGSNTTKYETVADRKGSTFTGVGGGQPSGNINSPQPFSNADRNNTGANDTSATNQYRSTRDGSPSLNGNGGGQQVGQPCAGCVGKADNKNPPGQAPNGTDRNAGYECDRNHGIGRSNPAHTGCQTTTTTPKYDCKGHLLPNNHGLDECQDQPKYDCKGHLLPNNHGLDECQDKPKYDCENHLLPNTHVHDCSKDEEKKITICHSTSSETNPFVVITISKNGLNGHEGHANDVIPAYTFKGVSYPAKNAGKPCGGTSNEPPKDCKGVVNGTATAKDCTPPKDCKGVVNGTATAKDCNPPKDCKGVVNGNATAADCTKNDVVDCKGVMNGTATAKDCTPPTSSVCPAGTTQMSDGSCSISGGGGGEGNNPTVVPVSGKGTPPVLVDLTGSPEAPATGPAEAPGALPFTGTDALLLAQLAALMLLVGGGLVGMSRKRKVIATL